jgi:ubiquitin-protein ligase
MSKNAATRRLLKELQHAQEEQKQFLSNNFPDVILELFVQQKNETMSSNSENIYDDLFHWQAWIQGPPETPYAGAYFLLDIVVHPQYPLYPPSVKFITRIFHPNVHFKTGEICLDLLKTEWSSV